MYIRVLCTIIYQSDNLAVSASDRYSRNVKVSRHLPLLFKQFRSLISYFLLLMIEVY